MIHGGTQLGYVEVRVRDMGLGLGDYMELELWVRVMG